MKYRAGRCVGRRWDGPAAHRRRKCPSHPDGLCASRVERNERERERARARRSLGSAGTVAVIVVVVVVVVVVGMHELTHSITFQLHNFNDPSSLRSQRRFLTRSMPSMQNRPSRPWPWRSS